MGCHLLVHAKAHSASMMSRDFVNFVTQGEHDEPRRHVFHGADWLRRERRGADVDVRGAKRAVLQHVQSASLGSAPARHLCCLLSARLAAPRSSALPGWAPIPGPQPPPRGLRRAASKVADLVPLTTIQVLLRPELL